MAEEKGTRVRAKAVPGPFTRLVVGRPRLVALSTACLALALALASYARGEPHLNLGTGWTDRHAIEQQRLDGLIAVQAEAYADGDGDKDKDDDDKEREARLDQVAIVYDAFEGGNMLGESAISTVEAFERALLGSAGWRKVCRLVYSSRRKHEDEARCASPASILNFLFVNDEEHRAQCEDGFCAVGPEQMSATCAHNLTRWGTFPCRSTVYDWRSGTRVRARLLGDVLERAACGDEASEPWLRDALLPRAAECGLGRTRHLRSFYDVGGPAAGFSSVDEAVIDQVFAVAESEAMRGVKAALNAKQDALSATATSDRATATAPARGRSFNVLWDAVSALKPVDALGADLLFALCSVLVVFVIVWRNVGSLFLALCAIWQIELSFAIALFCWRVVGGQDDIDFMQAMTLYLVLCIGADDVFVLVDAWKASAAVQPLTQPAAVQPAGAAPTPPVAPAGEEAGEAAAHAEDDDDARRRERERLEARFAHAYHTASSAMLTTTLTTVFALLVTASAPIPALKGFGIFGATLISVNYLQVISFYPACVLVHHSVFEGRAWWCARAGRAGGRAGGARRAPRCCWPWSKGRAGVDADAHAEADGAGAEREAERPKPAAAERRAVTLLRELAAPLLHRHRYALVACALCLCCVGLGLTVGLFRVAEGFPEDFDEHHPLVRIKTIQRERFRAAEDWRHGVYVVYGLDPDAPVSYRPTRQVFPPFAERAAPRYERRLTLDRAGQRDIVADCDAAKRERALVHRRQAYCLLNDLKAHVGDGAFPYEDEAALRSALESWYASAAYAQLRQELPDYERYTGFVAAGGKGVRALWHTFNSTVPKDLKNGPLVVEPHYNAWEGYVQRTCAAARGCFHILPPSAADWYRANWVYYALLRELLQVSLSGVLASLACALAVLLLVTRNARTALIAIVTILAIVVTVVGFIFAIGFEFGMFETVLLVLTIGLSVDYAVHLSHFYNEAEGTRYERARDALSGVGISVLGGALTTFSAGLPLAASVFVFFRLFGFFIFFTSFFAILYSFILLIPLLMILGPEGSQGSLDAMASGVRAWLKRAGRSRHRASPTAVTPPSTAAAT